MKVLITGGTGFIGSRLALAARNRGFDVRVTGQVNNDAERARYDSLAAAGIAVKVGALQDRDFAREIVAGREGIIHLAAAQHESNVADSYFHDVNVEGTRALIDAAEAAGVRRFVYGSTIGVFGSAANGELDEQSPPHPDNIYGRTKLMAEEIVGGHQGVLETVVIRISETYGPGDLRLLKLYKAINSGAFFMIGPGENRRQAIHVDDLDRGLLLALEHPAAPGQTFILAGQEITTTREFVQEIAGALGKSPPRLNVPLWPFKAAAIVFEGTFKPLGIQPPLHRRRLDFFTKSFVFSSRKAYALLGFVPQIPLHKGITETAQWYVSNGFL